jgi:uncharacterized LabA/DUF88 family protein
MHTKVYIDGENTFFHIFDALKKRRLVRYREDLVKFDMAGLLQEILGKDAADDLEYRYYGARLREIETSDELHKRTKKMIDHKRRWMGFLSHQHINFINAGELRVRDIREKGATEPSLTFEEKGVDVRMAVDMIEEAISGQLKKAIIWSSDADLLPVIHALRNHGVRVIYVAYEFRINDVMSASADVTHKISPIQIVEAFKRVNPVKPATPKPPIVPKPAQAKSPKV